MKIPSQLKHITDVMQDFKKPWFICGGWAIDLFLAQITREHTDIDIGIFREDQQALRKYLHDWRLLKIINSEMSEWNEDEFLQPPVHEIKAVKDDATIEILLNNSNETHWLYRRDDSISYPKEQLIQYRDTIPYWPPEISLLYKTKETRPKDDQDFENVIGHLLSESKQWLKNAIKKAQPEHRWVSRL
ncbi:MAG TPA: hypothetical protein VJI96_04980 [Candidatus Andersenbacteria bacterium]|nr:hypothetical protein [Candidatus Andersenbacteria bacterium]